ncbi:ribosomal protein S5 domain 2-type protein [Xylariomycetidae sp. FL2044]|nr:ribosomal protein S5 domain 2-type protein [Xylariomycetidae sp. FL2044]
MATAQHLLLSPAELAYLHTSLNLTPPLRPDGRTATQFRPLIAETGILPGTNGSARVCFADGTEAIVGVKAEVEKTHRTVVLSRKEEGKERRQQQQLDRSEAMEEEDSDNDEDEDDEEEEQPGAFENSWVEMTVEIPGYRDDDNTTVFLAAMLSEALLADGQFTRKLWINRRFHWKMYLDIILISPPLSYPLPLLSLTTHLALLSTRLPRLKSEADEDPMFDDDWDASKFIYPRPGTGKGKKTKKITTTTTTTTIAESRPPITLLVMAVGQNIIFDPSKEELAVADSALAVSVAETSTLGRTNFSPVGAMDVDVDVDGESRTGRNLQLVSVRTIDPPSRLTAPGVPNAVNAAAWGQGPPAGQDPAAKSIEMEDVEGVWKAPRGGASMQVLGAIVAKVLEKGGVADEVLEGLDGVELG